MSLATGSRLGPYEIVAPLGAGGMGEVYRARDTRLDRTVAIKVLSSQIAHDSTFRERFEREARAVSALDHPHICALYDVGEQDGTAFLVMQYLEGETLADRLAKGPLPLDQGLQCATQIADALDKAHRAGIIHRDLKPGNIMLTKAGVKLLDFGLAKATGPSAGPTVTALPTTPPGLTAEGAIVGTLQYMSPEQLEGGETDARTDIFAFGAVLYEMLTGRRAFEGRSQAGIISAIMSSQPGAVSVVQPLAPAALDYLVARCLAKSADDRWQSAHDLKLQLAWMAEPGAGPREQSTARRASSRERIAWVGAAVALVGLIVASALLLRQRGAEAPLRASQFTIVPPDDAQFRPELTDHAVSPDGRQVVFVATRRGGFPMLWVRPFDSLAARVLAGTEEPFNPFWSPDSQSIGFFAQGKLKRVEVTGGLPQVIADAPFGLAGTWSQNGVILFTPNLASPIWHVPASGGTAMPLTRLDERTRESMHIAPFFLPDGRHFLFHVASAESGVYVGSLDAGKIKRVLHAETGALYASGYLLFLRGTTLMAQPFDLESLTTSGTAVRVLEQVGRFITTAGASVATNGVLVVRPAVPYQTELAWADRTGGRVNVVAPPGDYWDIALAADDSQLAFSRVGPSNSMPDVWLMDLRRGGTSRLTTSPGVDNVPVWSPDGQTVAFASERDGALDVYQRAANQSVPETRLLQLNAPPIMFPADWSSDGKYLMYYRTDPAKQNDLWVVPLDGDRKPEPVVDTQFNEWQGQFSPDVKWIAYVSDDTGQPQVYVQGFPKQTGRWAISTQGGTQPRWRRDGNELFFLAPDRKLMAVTVKAGATFEAAAPRELFATTLDPGAFRQMYAVAADGKRFLLNAPLDTAVPPLTVVLNWPALLKQ